MGGRAAAAAREQDAFDGACRYLAARGDRPGPVLSRHAAEVFLQTGRKGFGIDSENVEGEDDFDRVAERWGVSFVVVDGPRFARAPANPLARLAVARPDRLGLVWGDPADVAVYEVVRGRHGPSKVIRP
jgi:hypothetical protein